MSQLALFAKKEIGVPLIVGEVGTLLGEGALGFGVGLGIGELYVRHQDKWVGRNAPWIATAFGKGLAALIQIFTGGHGGLVAGLADVVGQSGATAVGLETGLDHARKSSSALPPKTSMGELLPASAGRAMSWQQLAEIAAMS